MPGVLLVLIFQHEHIFRDQLLHALSLVPTPARGGRSVEPLRHKLLHVPPFGVAGLHAVVIIVHDDLVVLRQLQRGRAEFLLLLLAVVVVVAEEEGGG